MPNIKIKKKKLKIAEARRFIDHITVTLEDKDKGRVIGGVNIYNLESTLEDVEEAVKRAYYVEVGEDIPELKGKIIEVEYEEEE